MAQVKLDAAAAGALYLGGMHILRLYPPLLNGLHINGLERGPAAQQLQFKDSV